MRDTSAHVCKHWRAADPSPKTVRFSLSGSAAFPSHHNVICRNLFTMQLNNDTVSELFSFLVLGTRWDLTSQHICLLTFLKPVCLCCPPHLVREVFVRTQPPSRGLGRAQPDSGNVLFKPLVTAALRGFLTNVTEQKVSLACLLFGPFVYLQSDFYLLPTFLSFSKNSPQKVYPESSWEWHTT